MYPTNVKWLRTLTVLAMVAIWLPATNHCRLEQIPGLAFLTCCNHEESAPHQDNDCETDNCAAVEEGLYKTEDGHIKVAAPICDHLLLFCSMIPDPDEESRFLPVFLATSDLDLPAPWQFTFRAAAPPRAPSFAS